MKNIEALIELVKVSGPYIVAILGTLFGYLQSKRASNTQEKIAKLTQEKDLSITKLQFALNESQENRKNTRLILEKLEESYSPLYAKVESIMHSYLGIVANEKPRSEILNSLNELVVNEYIELSPMYRNSVLAKGIAFCQVLKNHNAYEIVVKLEGKITRALGLLDFSGNSCGEVHFNELKEARKEYQLLYASLFYCITNKEQS